MLSLKLRMRKCPGPVTFASFATADARPGLKVQASDEDVCTAVRLALARSRVTRRRSAAPTHRHSLGRFVSHARSPPTASAPAAANQAE